MNKREYIIRQIAKTNKKNYENYVITRIYHRLNRNDVKFMTQQYVNRPEGHALTDMYFPQLKLHIEIDEPFHKKQEKLDIDRETDIIQATNHEIARIKITEELNVVDIQVEELVKKIKSKIELKEKNEEWESWDLEKEFDPNFYRTKGYLDIKENPTFRTILDASNCLGQQYKGAQSAWFKSKVYENHNLWFPKFYENADWDNKIIEDGETIIEKCKKEDRNTHYENLINSPIKRIVFPRTKDNLGFILYKFKGIYVTDKERSSPENGMYYKRIATRIDIEK